MTGDLPDRTPSRSCYQQWMTGDVHQRVVFMPGPAKYSDPDDPAVQQHVLEVLDRPHIRTVLNHRTDGGGNQEKER